MLILFCDFLIAQQIFLSTQVKRRVIISKELLPSTQCSSQNENFVSTSKNLLKNRNQTFPLVYYFT